MTNSVRFLHIRLFTHDIEQMFGPTKASAFAVKGGKTICYREDPDGNIWYSVAKCSSKDNFCKRIGREVSLGRMRGKTQSMLISKEERMKLEQTGQKYNVVDLLFRAEG